MSIIKYCILTLMSLSMGVIAADSMVVAYKDEGKMVSVQGSIEPGRYLFNAASNKTISLATLDWPPYISEKLCNRGWVFQLAVALLVKQGYQVSVEFMPWARAVKEVESGRIDVLFPEYPIEATAPSDSYSGFYRLDLLALSDAFPGGEVAFVKRKNYSVSFQGDLSLLSKELIGVVRGYQNTREFDALMDQGRLNITEAVNDLQLVRLLAAKRVNLIVGDPEAFKSSIRLSDLSDPQKSRLLKAIEPVKPVLQYNNLHFAVSKRAQNWQDKQAAINQALSEFKNSGEIDRFIQSELECEKGT